MSTRQNTRKTAYTHETVGFGVPVNKDIEPHHFVVQIPRATRAAVHIEEDIGPQGKSAEATIIPRAEVARSHWSAIKGPVKRVFNARLKAHGLRAGQFSVGGNMIDRLLGKELCVLAWGIQGTGQEQVPTALRNWLDLKPEERWWIFGMTAASAGGMTNPGEGWRMAVRYLLTDRLIGTQTVRPGTSTPSANLGLFADPPHTDTNKDR